MIEFKRDRRSGDNDLMEVNPRFWGSLQLAVDSGVDFPWYLVQVALGLPVTPVTSWRVGARLRWFLGDIDHFIARILRTREELHLDSRSPGFLRAAASVLCRGVPGSGARCFVSRTQCQPYMKPSPGSERHRSPMPKPLRTLRPVRVAHIIQNLNYGRMERVLNGLASELPARGFEVHAVALEYLGRFAEGLWPVATLHNPSHMGRLSLLWPSKLFRLLRSIQPDIVHSHTGVWLKAARAARAAGTPVVLHTEHGRPAPVPVSDRLLDNLASRSTDTVIAVSSSLAALLRDQVVTPCTPIHVIHRRYRRESPHADKRRGSGSRIDGPAASRTCDRQCRPVGAGQELWCGDSSAGTAPQATAVRPALPRAGR